MNKRRLLKLADELDALAKSRRKSLPKFSLVQWGWQRKERQGRIPTELSCARAACAVGTAMLMPSFQRQGLKCRVEGNRMMVPLFRGHQNWQAVDAFFFNIAEPSRWASSDEATWLFQSNSYPKGQRTGKTAMLAVAKRIRNFVAGEARPG